MRYHVLIVLFLGILLRVIFLPNPGFEADVSFWKSWGLATLDKGIVEGMKVTNNNYPTPFAYILGIIVWIYRFFADPHNFNEFWKNTNLLFLTIAKLPAVIADFGIFAVILWLTKSKSKILNSKQGLILASMYLLNPIGIIDGAWWGQVDSLGVFIFLLAFLAALTKRPMLAGIIFMTSMMTKLQNMIYGPLFFLFIRQTLGYEGLIRSIGGAMLAFFGLNIEFFLAREMKMVINSLTQNFDYFPWMSLNAFNLWWIVSAARGMQVSDKLLAVGIANAKTVGLIIFSSCYLFAGLRQTKNHLRTFIESLILVNSAFFLFQTQSHDRYAFPLSVFLLLLAPFTKNFKLFSILYLIFTILYSYNLHTALVFNYPINGLPILSSAIQPFLTISVSFLLIGLFLIFLVYLFRNARIIVFWAAAVFLFITLLFKNLPLITKKPVSLTSFTPWVKQQGYGETMKDMPVNAYLGFSKWSPLSVQYAFYRKGIGTHANSYMDFDIGGHFKKFSTDYGIDTEAGEKGTAIFEIYGDGKKLFASDKIGRYESPRHVEVDVSGVKTLGLVTTDAGDGINDDHTDWLRPTLWP